MTLYMLLLNLSGMSCAVEDFVFHASPMAGPPTRGFSILSNDGLHVTATHIVSSCNYIMISLLTDSFFVLPFFDEACFGTEARSSNGFL